MGHFVTYKATGTIKGGMVCQLILLLSSGRAG
jgi:hypothetical protein